MQDSGTIYGPYYMDYLLSMIQLETFNMNYRSLVLNVDVFQVLKQEF